MLRAKDVMSRTVISIGPYSTVKDAAQLMIDRNISAVPVIDGTRLVGILSGGDLVHRAEIGTAEHRRSWWLRLFRDPDALARQYARSHSRHVFDVMTRRVHTVSEITPVTDVAQLLDRHKIKRVPVMRGETVVGIVSRADLMRAIVAAANAAPLKQEEGDLAIRARLLQELHKQPWATAFGSNLEVAEGLVSFSGCVGSEEERRATRVLAENLPGVRGVEDHRVIVDYPTVAL